jgi:hypothetical protein
VREYAIDCLSQLVVAAIHSITKHRHAAKYIAESVPPTAVDSIPSVEPPAAAAAAGADDVATQAIGSPNSAHLLSPEGPCSSARWCAPRV